MGLFEPFRRGLDKTRSFIGERLNRLVASFGVFDEDMLDELEDILIQADTGVRTATELTDSVRDYIRDTGHKDRESVLAHLAVSMKARLPVARFELWDQGLNIVLMVGVNGTGKTTTAAKLAFRYKQENRRVMLAAADTFRAAAIDQLVTWGERIGVRVLAHQAGADPAAVVYDAVTAARARKLDVLLIDTAGRLHNKKNLMDELEKIHRVVGREAPDARVTSLLVLDATTGQNAVSQARAFNEVTKLDGLVLAKLDGNAKGGVAFAVAAELELPIFFAGLGEGLDDLVDFDADLFVRSLLPGDAGP